MLTQTIRKHAVALLSLPVLLALPACYMEVNDKADDEEKETRITHPDNAPFGLDARAEACSAADKKDELNLDCYQKDDYRWRTSCKASGCQEIKVFVHYMLTEDIGGKRVVHVEAFDNEHFQGAPVSTVRISNFEAKRGEWRDGQLFVEPGEYYVRAYLTTEDDDVEPYVLGDMRLIGQEPVGVFGASSGAEMIRVEPKSQSKTPAPVHVYLDKLFKKPGSEPDTNAHLRINLQVAEGQTAPDGRQVKVELRKGSDLAEAPSHSFEIATELLLVQGRPGKTEFVSPSLPEGNYVVFVYLDANGNDLYDAEEMAELYKVNQQPAAIAIRKDRTETVNMTLSAPSAQTNN